MTSWQWLCVQLIIQLTGLGFAIYRRKCCPWKRWPVVVAWTLWLIGALCIIPIIILANGA